MKLSAKLLVNYSSALFASGLFLLAACGPPPANQGGPSVSSSVLPSGQIQPGSAPSLAPSALPSMSPLPSPTVQAGAGSGLANVSSLRFEASNRFLNAKGESTRIYLTLLDSAGLPLSAEAQPALPIEWISTRPQDIAVDEQGVVKALVADGYSTIIARLVGTSYEVQTLISVSSASGNGGSGRGGVSQTLKPVIQSLSVSNTDLLGAGSIISLNARASLSGGNLNSSHYSWSCHPAGCGSFSPATGPHVYWQAPAAPGSYTLELTVRADNQSVSQSVQVNLQTGTGGIAVNPEP